MKKVRITLTTLLVIMSMLYQPFAVSALEFNAQGSVYYNFYDPIVRTGTYTVGSDNGFRNNDGAVLNTSYSGPIVAPGGGKPAIVTLKQDSIDQGIDYVGGYFTGNQIPALDYRSTALRISLKKGVAQSGYRLGLTCFGNVHLGSSDQDVTRVGGITYINIDDWFTDADENGWITVEVPLSYFKNHEEPSNFIVKETVEEGYTGTPISSFDWDRINGVYTACRREASMKSNALLYYTGKTEFIDYVSEPKNVTAYENGTNNVVSWSQPVTDFQIDGYEIYRNNNSTSQKIGEVLSDERTFTDVNAPSEATTYSVVTIANNGVVLKSIPAKSNEVTNLGADISANNGTATVNLELRNWKGQVLSSLDNCEFVRYFNANVTFDNNLFEGTMKIDIYHNSIHVDNITEKIANKGASSKTYSYKKDIFTILPGVYTFKVSLYKNETLVLGSERSFVFTKSEPIDAAKNVTVLPSDAQVIDGWGFNDVISLRDFNGYINWNEGQSKVDELGANYVRLFVFSDLFNNDGSLKDDYDEFLECVKAHTDKGRDYILSFTYGRPSSNIDKEWLVTRLAGYYEESGWMNALPSLKYEYEDIFVQSIINQMKRISEKNIPLPKYYSIQNEPEGNSKMSFKNPIQYARIVIALRNALDANGFEQVKIMGPDSNAYKELSHIVGDNGIRDSYTSSATMYYFDFSEFERNADFNDAIDLIAVHSYGSTPYDNVSKKIAENYRENVKNKHKWMTELCLLSSKSYTYADENLDYDIESLFSLVEHLLGDVHGAGNNAWFYHSIYDFSQSLLNDNSAVHLLQSARSEVYQLSLFFGAVGSKKAEGNNVYYFLSNLYNAAPKGSVVKLVDTDWATLQSEQSIYMDVGAFEYGGATIIVLQNQSSQAEYVNIDNVSGTKADVKTFVSGIRSAITSQTVNVENGKGRIYIPAKSVNLIVCN